MARETFTIFYAWQNDHKSNHCRQLIRDAADMAAAAINGDTERALDLVIDQDTQGEPGLCDIPATILSKIESCDGFLCDLTYVATTKEGRHCSNPNVLFELGFAFHAIGHKRIVLVMNEHFGPTTEQIFDLNHRRHPHFISLPETRRSKKKCR